MSSVRPGLVLVAVMALIGGATAGSAQPVSTTVTNNVPANPNVKNIVVPVAQPKSTNDTQVVLDRNGNVVGIEQVSSSASSASSTQAQSLAATMPPDHKFRTVAECKLLLSYEQPACTACVERPGTPKHIYRPEWPAGDRCRLDNGKP